MKAFYNFQVHQPGLNQWLVQQQIRDKVHSGKLGGFTCLSILMLTARVQSNIPAYLLYSKPSDLLYEEKLLH